MSMKIFIKQTHEWQITFYDPRFGIWLNFEEHNIDLGCHQIVGFRDTIIYDRTQACDA